MENRIRFENRGGKEENRAKTVGIFVNDILDGKLPEDSFAVTDYILSELYRLNGKKYNEQDNRITREQNQFVREFFDALIEKLRSLSLSAQSSEEQDELKRLCSDLYHSVFSVSPSIFNRLAPADMVQVTSSLLAIPEARMLAGNAAGEFVYETEFNDLGWAYEDAVKKADTPHALDIALALRVLAQDAMNQGWADRAVNIFLDTGDKLVSNPRQHPVVRYGAEVSVERIREALKDGSQVVRASSPEPASVTKGYDEIGRPVNTAPIARDAKGEVDNDGSTARVIFGESAVADAEIARIKEVEYIKDVLHSLQQGGGTLLNIVFAARQVGGLFGGQLEELVKESTPEWKDEDWEKAMSMLKEHNRLLDEYNRLTQRAREEAENTAEQASERATQDAIKQVPNLREESVNPHVISLLELVKQEPNMERRFHRVEEAYRFLSIQTEMQHEQAKGAAKRFIDDWDALLNTHENLWRANMIKEKERQDALNSGLAKLWSEIDPIMPFLEARREILIDEAEQVVEKERQLAIKDIAKARFVPVQRLVKELGFFSEQDAENISLLFRQMHHPDVRKKFERDFGVDIRDLYLREQVWFLEYLGRTKTEEANRLAKTTKKFGIDIARAFLASEQDEKAAEAILNIAEKLPEEDARKVFERYGALVDVARKEVDELLREFFVSANGKEIDAQSLEREILRRGKELIIGLGRDILSGGKIDIGTVERRLRRASEDAVIFSSIFKTAYHGKDTILFNELRAVSFERMDWSELRQDEAETIKRIHWDNWSEQSPEEAEVLQKKLERALDGIGNNQFYILKRNEEIMAFARTGEEDDVGAVLPEGH
ncbi:MAG: hypothetical protein AAB886_00360 [Patescibacteria group bacterium]